MTQENLVLTADPMPTRRRYLTTAFFVFCFVIILHLGSQWRIPPLINARISILICFFLGFAALYGLTRSRLTQRLKIDFLKKVIVIEYITVTKEKNVMELPFGRLRVHTDTSFGTTSYGSKWKVTFMRDDQLKYSVFSDEPGFSESRLTEFVENAKAIATESHRNYDAVL